MAFNGNCAEAVAHYENAFNVKAMVMRYKDAPSESGYKTTEETENLVMHAQLDIGCCSLMLADMPPENPVKIGDNVNVMAEFEEAEKLDTVFNALKEGGRVHMELQATFFSKRFGSLTDKFGIGWNMTLGHP